MFLLFIPVPSLFEVGPFLISSDLIALQFPLDIVRCTPLSPQSVHPISSHFISSQFISTPVSSPHLIWVLLSLLSDHLSSSLPKTVPKPQPGAKATKCGFESFSKQITSSTIQPLSVFCGHTFSNLVSHSHGLRAMLEMKHRFASLVGTLQIRRNQSAAPC